MIKHRIDLFGKLMDTHKVRNHGIGSKPDVPSKFWPDADSNTFDEITNWKNDLRKEQKGQTDFNGNWGMGASFEKKIDIDLLLKAFYNVNGEYYESEEKVCPRCKERPIYKEYPLCIPCFTSNA